MPLSREITCRIALLPDCHVRSDMLDTPEEPCGFMRRLYPYAASLLESHVEAFNAGCPADLDAIFLLGDTLDPADETGLAWLNALIERSEIPIYPIIGNHECYGDIPEETFHRALGLPHHGNYVVRVRGIPFVMLATSCQHCLEEGSEAFQWLEDTLDELDGEESVFCCAHYSLLLHPCVQGWSNDGMQVLRTADQVLGLLRRHPNVRAWIAGHKNVPSKMIHEGVLHLLSPQLIQAPCGFRELHVADGALQSVVHEITNSTLAQISRDAYGTAYPERHGAATDRDFSFSWTDD